LVSGESEFGSTIDAHKFVYYELEFDLNNPYIPTNEEIMDILDEKNNAIVNETIEKANNVKINDVMVDRIGFKDAESALVTLKQFLEQRPIDVTSLIQSIKTLQKELGS